MNVALIGSVSSSWHALDALIRSGLQITGVLGVDESQAERVSDFRALRELATAARVPFQSFVKVSEPAVETFLRDHAPDLLWVIGLSQLVPQQLIAIATHGAVGFHPTMLPQGRGRAPVAWTILLNRRAAANLFFLTDEPDAGDILVQREVPVLPDDYSEDLIHRTNLVLAKAIVDLAPRLKSGDLPRTPQDHSRATYYAKRTPADGLIDWARPRDEIYRLIRAAGRPYPGAFTHAGDARLTVWRARPAQPNDVVGDNEPGAILRRDPSGHLLVACGDGGLWLTEIKLEGDSPGESRLAVGALLK